MRPGFVFSTRFRVRYSEIDGQKIVFNSRYLEYADVALSEFWRWADLGDIGPDWQDAEFNYVRATLDYKRPFRLDDMVEAFVRIVGITLTPGTTHGERKEIWRRFGMWLLLGLEFELAADIIDSVVAPSWQDIGQLGAIAVIRTFLNYFLEKDLDETEETR